MRRLIALAALLTMLLTAAPSLALSIRMESDSVEWLVHAYDGIAHVRFVRDDAGRVRAKVVARLKGDLPDFITFVGRETWAPEGFEYLVFFADRVKEFPSDAPDKPAGPVWVECEIHQLVIEKIHLPSFADRPLSKEELLTVVRDEAKRPRNPNSAFLAYVRYPLDERFYALAHRHMDSPNPDRRMRAIWDLSELARPEDLRRFRTFAQDPHTEPQGRGRSFRITFPVRGAASWALQKAGERVDDIVTNDPHFTDVKPAYLALAAIPPVGVLALMFLLRDRRRPHTLLTRLCAVTSALCILLSLTIAALWLRSIWRVDQALLYTPDHRFELTSAPHALQLVRFDTSELPNTQLLRTTFAPGSRRDELWRFDALQSTTSRNLAGIRWIAGAPKAVRYPPWEGLWRGLRIPYPWLLAATLATLAASHLTSARARRRLHTKRGLCPRCGYDLRATTALCPECGWAVPAK
jgi:hypothetical protein